MNATCRPFSIATSAASSATIVLPAPTSPCSSRFIGCGFCRSSTISFSDWFCPLVSRNGSPARDGARGGTPERQHRAPRVADAIVEEDGQRLLLGRRRVAAREHAHLEDERLLEDQAAL